MDSFDIDKFMEELDKDLKILYKELDVSLGLGNNNENIILSNEPGGKKETNI